MTISMRRPQVIYTPDEASPMRYLCLAPVVIYDSLFFLLPLLFLIWIGFWTVENYRAVPGFSLANYSDIFSQLFSRSRYGLAIAQSLWVAATTTLLGLLLCYPFALMLAFGVPPARQRFALVLAIAPFWTSYILRLYAWQTVINTNGLLNTLLIRLGWIETPLPLIFTQAGTRIGLLHYLAPIMILILYLVVRGIDPTLLKASQNLGANTWQTFWRVLLPLSKPGLVYSAVFGAIISLGDVLSGIILGGGTGKSWLGAFPLFSTVIFNEYAASTNLPRTSALATVLIGLMAMILVAGLRFSRMEE
ncbi:MAG: ABC transporter permease [Cyanobacteriota bacterium]|nr:ABC transporter permease [Cyanobacteriota bacterium]